MRLERFQWSILRLYFAERLPFFLRSSVFRLLSAVVLRSERSQRLPYKKLFSSASGRKSAVTNPYSRGRDGRCHRNQVNVPGAKVSIVAFDSLVLISEGVKSWLGGLDSHKRELKLWIRVNKQEMSSREGASPNQRQVAGPVESSWLDVSMTIGLSEPNIRL